MGRVVNGAFERIVQFYINPKLMPSRRQAEANAAFTVKVGAFVIVLLALWVIMR